MLIVRSPVRISFGGGGTDLPAYYECFGGNVLSVSINKYFYSILRTRNDGRIQVISSDLRVFETWHDIGKMAIQGSELDIPLAALKDVGCNISVDLFLASEIPPGTGLGSSASVCVNILRALSTYAQKPLSKYELAERAFNVARNVLGKCVGKQDEYAAAFGGLNYISINNDGSTQVKPLNLDNIILREFQSNLMLFFTGSAHHSWSILEEQENSTRNHSTSCIEALHEVKALAARMRQLLEKGELEQFAELLDAGWQAKRRISNKISTPRIDRLYSCARNAGALGGKITGAGGGGFLLLYCDVTNQPAVRQALLNEGVQEMAFNFDMHGTQVIVNDPFIDGDEKGGSRWIFVPNPPAAPDSA
jgi:D-glycero-alpha-D-manno-heptose-7-phosphate kinase